MLKEFIINVVVCIVEFKKYGLFYVYVLLFLYYNDKYFNFKDIDKMICVEIFDWEFDFNLYEVVKDFMIYGLCGLFKLSLLCMKEGNWLKYFFKKFNERISVDEDGYFLYWRRDYGKIVE